MVVPSMTNAQGQVSVIQMQWSPEAGAKGTFDQADHSYILAVKKPNKMNCELILTFDTPAHRQTGSRNMTGPKTLPTIWGTYMKLVTKYQIYAINSC